jgi:hypothetical protein
MQRDQEDLESKFNVSFGGAPEQIKSETSKECCREETESCLFKLDEECVQE